MVARRPKELEGGGDRTQLKLEEIGAFMASGLLGKFDRLMMVNDRRLTEAILLQRRTFDRVRWREILHDIQRHLAEQVYSSTGSRVGKLLDGAA